MIRSKIKIISVILSLALIMSLLPATMLSANDVCICDVDVPTAASYDIAGVGNWGEAGRIVFPAGASIIGKTLEWTPSYIGDHVGTYGNGWGAVSLFVLAEITGGYGENDPNILASVIGNAIPTGGLRTLVIPAGSTIPQGSNPGILLQKTNDAGGIESFTLSNVRLTGLDPACPVHGTPPIDLDDATVTAKVAELSGYADYNSVTKNYGVNLSAVLTGVEFGPATVTDIGNNQITITYPRHAAIDVPGTKWHFEAFGIMSDGTVTNVANVNVDATTVTVTVTGPLPIAIGLVSVPAFEITLDPAPGTLGAGEDKLLTGRGGKLTSLPTLADLPDREFKGWLLNGSPVDTNTVFTDNATLVAKYELTSLVLGSTAFQKISDISGYTVTNDAGIEALNIVFTAQTVAVYLDAATVVDTGSGTVTYESPLPADMVGKYFYGVFRAELDNVEGTLEATADVVEVLPGAAAGNIRIRLPQNPTGALVFIAVPTFDVTFDAMMGKIDGAETKTLTTREGGMITDPLPTVAGADLPPNLTFDGWFMQHIGGGTQVTAMTAYTTDTTVYAQYTAQLPTDPAELAVVQKIAEVSGYDISFVLTGFAGLVLSGVETEILLDGGTGGGTVTGIGTGKITITYPLPDAYKTGEWHFEAFGIRSKTTAPYLSPGLDSVDVSNDVVTITLTGNDLPAAIALVGVPVYTITFDAVPGNIGGENTVIWKTGKGGRIDSALTVLPTAVHGTLTFDGWFTASTGGVKVNFEDVNKQFFPTDSPGLTLYARYIGLGDPETCLFGCVGPCISRGPGDLNHDGNVNNADLIMMRRYLVTMDVNLPGLDFPMAHINGDIDTAGLVNNADLVRMRRFLVTQDDSLLDGTRQ